MFEYTKSLLEKTKIEEVAAAMKSNELPSKLHYANLSSLSLADESITQICTNMGNEDISFVTVVIANDKALSYKRELKVSFSDMIATFGNEYLINLFYNKHYVKHIFFRWNHGPIHWNEPAKFGGTHILVVEMSSKFLS